MAHHGAGLRQALEREARSTADAEGFVGRLITDYRALDLPPAERAMLDYAVKLTRTPAALGQGDVEALRAQGLDDRAIHDVCAIAAYFAFVNRLADGLGVELEDRFDPPHQAGP